MIRTICFDQEAESTNGVLYHNHVLVGGGEDEDEVSEPVAAQPVRRIYKGEGTVQFVSFYPFARCGNHPEFGVSKWGNYYTNSSSAWISSNASQWLGAAGLSSSQGYYDITPSNVIHTYNPGDMDADVALWFVPVAGMSITCDGQSFTLGDGFALNSEDTYIRYNSRTQLFEGSTSNFAITSNLYNDQIHGGFKIPMGVSSIRAAQPSALAKIDYDYLYY